MSHEGDQVQDPSNPDLGAIAADHADARSWEELLAARQFGAAYRAFRIARTIGMSDAHDPEAAGIINHSLATLADVEELVRERSFTKASTRLQRMEERAPFAPWEELEADVATLEQSAKLLDQRETEQALEALARLDGSWFLAEALAQRGTAHIYEGRLEEARQSFEDALAIDPQHYRALTNLGNVALEEKRVDDAIDYYLRAIKLNESFANAHHNLGVAYRRKGHLSKSVRSLKTAQRMSQRKEASDARAKLGKLSGGPNTAKWLRWLLIAGAAIAAYYLFLRN